MSLLNPYKFRGVEYETPQQVKAAKRRHSEEMIRERNGLRGKLARLLHSKKKMEEYY